MCLKKLFKKFIREDNYKLTDCKVDKPVFLRQYLNDGSSIVRVGYVRKKTKSSMQVFIPSLNDTFVTQFDGANWVVMNPVNEVGNN